MPLPATFKDWCNENLSHIRHDTRIEALLQSAIVLGPFKDSSADEMASIRRHLLHLIGKAERDKVKEDEKQKHERLLGLALRKLIEWHPAVLLAELAPEEMFKAYWEAKAYQDGVPLAPTPRTYTPRLAKSDTPKISKDEAPSGRRTRRPMLQAETDKIRKMWVEGKSLKTIANKFNRDKHYVELICRNERLTDPKYHPPERDSKGFPKAH